jgi:sulfur-carrier protein adenylyltransferase/sulfurtransferase
MCHRSIVQSFNPQLPNFSFSAVPRGGVMKSYQDLVRESKTRVREVSAEETQRLLQEHPGTVLVDCREPNECALGRIPGAVVIPRGVLEQHIERAAARQQKVILYCASGNRSALAADMLQQMGYTDVASMAGGIRAWVDSGGDIAE